MGKTFSSIHVLKANQNELVHRLKKSKHIASMRSFMFNNLTKDALDLSKEFNNGILKLPRIIDIIKPDIAAIYLVRSGNDFSLFSYSIAFLSVKDFVHSCFHGYNGFIISTEMFDGDILCINIYKGDLLLTSYCSGKGYEAEGYRESRFDLQIIHEIWQVNDEQISAAYCSDLYQSCQNLSALFKLPLCVGVDDIAENPKIYNVPAHAF